MDEKEEEWRRRSEGLEEKGGKSGGRRSGGVGRRVEEGWVDEWRRWAVEE